MFPMQLILATTGLSLSSMPFGQGVASVTDCLLSCYYDVTCSSLFFDNSTNLCYLSDTLYGQELNTSSSAMKYYRWERDDCIPGYTFRRSMDLCYKVYLDIAGWFAARHQCVIEGSYLIKVDSSRVNDMVYAVARDAAVSIWLGAKRNVGTTNMYWMDGTLVGGVTFWANGQPCTTCTIEETVAVNYQESSAMSSWHDFDPANGMGYICQYDMTSTVC